MGWFTFAFWIVVWLIVLDTGVGVVFYYVLYVCVGIKSVIALSFCVDLRVLIASCAWWYDKMVWVGFVVVCYACCFVVLQIFDFVVVRVSGVSVWVACFWLLLVVAGFIWLFRCLFVGVVVYTVVCVCLFTIAWVWCLFSGGWLLGGCSLLGWAYYVFFSDCLVVMHFDCWCYFGD